MTHPIINREKSDKQEACKTFIEQTKLLTSLASAFIIAPAVVKGFTELVLNRKVFVAETAFVISVVAGYTALGAISGTQFRGEYNVHRPAVKWSGLIQFCAYLLGIVLFGWWMASYPTPNTGIP